MSTHYISLADTLAYCDVLGLKVRDLGLLDSALHRPSAEFAGIEAYASVPLKAAALLHSVATNHALFDGNKRLSWMVSDIFLRRNGFASTLSQEDAVAVMLWVAAVDVGVEDIVERLAIRAIE